MTYIIESDIPMPEGRSAYPFSQMEVGQSFFMPCEEKDAKRIAGNARNAARRFPDRKFTSRVMENGVRVWRVA